MSRWHCVLLCGCISVVLLGSAARGQSPTTRGSRGTQTSHSGLADRVAELTDGDPVVRRRAAQRLGGENPKAYFAANALIKATSDAEPDVKAAAIEALGRLYEVRGNPRLAPNQEPVRGRAMKAIAGCIDDPQVEVRREAMNALGRIGAPAAAYAPRFLEILKDPREEQVLSSAANAFRLTAPDGSAVLRELLQHVGVPAQHAILFALASSSDPADRAAIVPFLKSSEPRLVKAALMLLSLRKSGVEDGTADQVVELCSSDDASIRAAAIRAAVHFVDGQRLEAILHKAESDQDPDVVSAVGNVRRRLAGSSGHPASQPSSRPTRRPRQ